MARPSPSPISTSEYWEGRSSAAGLDELVPNANFMLRRQLTAGETFRAFAAKAIGLAMEHPARIKTVEEFRGLFTVTVNFVTQDGELAYELRPTVNAEGIICKKRSPSVERGYFMKQKDKWDLALDDLTSEAPTRANL